MQNQASHPSIMEPFCDIDHPILKQVILPLLVKDTELIKMFGPVSPKGLAVALSMQDGSSTEVLNDAAHARLTWLLKDAHFAKIQHIASDIIALRLSHNGALAPELHRLTALRVLHIAREDANHRILPEHVRLWREKMPRLEDLQVQLEAEIENDQDVPFKGIKWPIWADAFWAELLQITALKRLHLASKTLLVCPIPALGALSELESLTLKKEYLDKYNSFFVGAERLSIDMFANLNALTRLEIRSMNFKTDAAIALPGLLPSLREIKINGSPDDKALLPNEMEAWRGFPHLERLDIDVERLSVESVEQIARIATLEHLSIQVISMRENFNFEAFYANDETVNDDVGANAYAVPDFGELMNLRSLAFAVVDSAGVFPLSALVGLEALTSLNNNAPMMDDVDIEELPDLLPSLQSLKWQYLDAQDENRLQEAFASREGFQLEF